MKNLNRNIIITINSIIIFLLLLLPLIVILKEALSLGLVYFWHAISNEEALSALYLSFKIAFFAVIFNVIFGIAASWSITKFDFIGKDFLITLIEIPFSISPVVVGYIFVLMLGKNSAIGGFLDQIDIDIIFSTKAMIIVTIFVTLPYIARELIVIMQDIGREQEEAAYTLGASGMQILYKITLPNIKWALIYGIILTIARALGEFGAVSIVSGHIRGSTNSLPLYIEILYNEYQFTDAFAVSAIVVLISVIIIIAKMIINNLSQQKLKNL
jgi:sulfate/thiosulfate transport system permease protein